jgi:glycine betaine/proline transport system permease protein
VTALSIPRPSWLARPVARRTLAASLAVAIVVLYLVFRDQFVLEHDDRHPAFRSLTDLRATIDATRSTNPALLFLVDFVRVPVGSFVELFATTLAALPWLGVTVTVAMIGLVTGGWRMALVGGLGFLSFGLLGLWEESMDTLALTLAAVVLSLAVGVPLGIWAGRDDRFMSLIRPILDTLQIMPTIAYLAPLTLFFLIGPATAAIATMIYAVPTTIRITALGIRGVPPASLEASVSLGATRWQTLRKVQLPMARRTLILGINQTMMMALAMVVITALINAPGLGQSVVRALQRVDVGRAFVAGLAIVIMAVVLDRLTTAASVRSEARFRAGQSESAERRRMIVGGAIIASVVAMVVGFLVPLAATFPDEANVALAGPVNDVSDWVKLHGYEVTTAIKDVVTYGLINPLQSLLTSSPWWLVVMAVVGFTLLMGTARAAATAGAALLLIVLLGLWEHGMITLATTLVAAAITLGVGLAGGILFARRQRLATALRPVLDAAQTMPSFVYLVPVVALFGATRFTAIIAAFIYAAPSVIRLVEDGIRGVPPTVTEAAISTGATPRQLLWKVQLPVARPSLLLAANQGIVLVLAMVVVGGLVGAGALGFDVVEGFSQRADFGKGLAAGIAIVLLGIMLDRISQGAAGRRPAPTRADEA